MKTILHTLNIAYGEPRKKLFQVSLPRNAKSIAGVMVQLNNTDGYGSGLKAILLSFDAGYLTLSAPGEPSCFFSQTLMVQKQEENIDFIPPRQTFFFSGGESYIHGKPAGFLTTNIPLSSNLLEGFYENVLPLNGGDSYQVHIHLKLALYD